MPIITYPAEVNIQEVAKKVKQWFDQKKFESRTIQVADSYVIKARKKSTFRAVVGADRALEVSIRNSNGDTQIEVRQGSWKTNAISNVAWLVATGGMNLAISGWSIIAQKELESHIRSILDQVAGAKEINL